VHGFLEGIEGIDFENKRRIGIRNDRYEADCPVVVRELGRPRAVHADEVAYARQHTERKLKFTLPGPMTIVDTLADDHYGAREEMARAFADILNAEARDLIAAGADVIQFDEPAFNAYTELVPGWGVEALNRTVAGLDATTAVHICYGYGIQANIDWKARLGAVWDEYSAILPALADSDVDQISLEFAGSRVPFEVLRYVGGRKDILVGAIDVATDRIESPDEVAQTLRQALEYLPPERVVPCTNCGMVPLKRELAYAKLAKLAEGAALVRDKG
jgi:5-methyltetrahydropteroyltriglutamate--homocysteine methyltransferase